MEVEVEVEVEVEEEEEEEDDISPRRTTGRNLSDIPPTGPKST